MSEWIVDVQSMLPLGEFGERMIVARMDRAARTIDLMTAIMTTIPESGLFDADKVFMTTATVSGAFGINEIDQFLQAMMEAGWKRGLRPKNFDPSAGELVAVQRHLEDMRKIALEKGEDVPEPVVEEKKW